MPQAILRIRVERLERQVDDMLGMLRTLMPLPGQIAQLREDTRVAVSELRSDVGGLKHDVAELKHDVAELKRDVAELKSDVAVLKKDAEDDRQELRASIVTLLRMIREGDEETRRYLRVLYEDLCDRIRTIRENGATSGGPA